MKTYVVTPHWNRPDETALMMGRSIRLKAVIWKIIPFTPSNLETVNKIQKSWHCCLRNKVEPILAGSSWAIGSESY